MMIDLVELQKTVQEAIDNGATSVEQVHKQIANMPLEYLAKIEQLEGPVSQAKDFQDKTIGSIYETIHNINTKVGDMAKELLAKMNIESTNTTVK
jgi:uncharacterized protein YaaR (DUF327 family)